MKKVTQPEKIQLVLKQATTQEIQAYIDELERLLSEKKEALEKSNSKMERLKIFLQSNDIGSNVLFSEHAFKRKPKYAWIDEKGDLQKWSGVGRRPLGLQVLLNEGHSLEEFEIKQIMK